MTEWRPVVGFPAYEVSDDGQVRRISDLLAIPRHTANKSGHLRVSLKETTGAYRQRYIHRLVLESFVGACPEGLEACHNDGDGTNNRLDNLRWDTHSSNMYDKVKHGVHHHANRSHCPHGHPLDAVKRHGDGTFWQRRCSTCLREANREREAAKWAQVKTCRKGHPFDGVAYKADGSVRSRFCKTCRSESVSRQMTARHAAKRASR